MACATLAFTVLGAGDVVGSDVINGEVASREAPTVVAEIPAELLESIDAGAVVLTDVAVVSPRLRLLPGVVDGSAGMLVVSKVENSADNVPFILPMVASV